jgi:hypothetical protein
MAPDLGRITFSGSPDVNGTYKNCRKTKRKFYDMSVVLNLGESFDSGDVRWIFRNENPVSN